MRDSNEKQCKCGKRDWAQRLSCSPTTSVGGWKRRGSAGVRSTTMFESSSQGLRRLESRFECPVCGIVIGGFAHLKCQCSYGGQLLYTVHRAAVVYTPRSMVMVNPPNAEVAAQLKSSAAAEMALEWVLDGMPGAGPPGRRKTRALTPSSRPSWDKGSTKLSLARGMAEAAAKSAGGAVVTDRSVGVRPQR